MFMTDTLAAEVEPVLHFLIGRLGKENVFYAVAYNCLIVFFSIIFDLVNPRQIHLY